MNQAHFVNHGAGKFFEFLAGQGVNWFFVDGQPRKLDKNRGAPIGAIFGFKKGVHVSKVLSGFEEFGRRCAREGKKQVDLITRESPARAGARIVLADDLNRDQLDELRTWWPGPMIWLETSFENFQALVISPHPLQPDDQKRFADFLVAKLGADPGAATIARFHRFPGSPNYKNGEPFYCRLVAIFEGDGDDPEDIARAIEEALMNSERPAPTRRATVPTKAPGKGQDNSAAACSWTMSQLRRGAAEEEILTGLGSPAWLAHHDPHDWPARTLHNSKFLLGWVPTRYTSRPKS